MPSSREAEVRAGGPAELSRCCGRAEGCPVRWKPPSRWLNVVGHRERQVRVTRKQIVCAKGNGTGVSHSGLVLQE